MLAEALSGRTTETKNKREFYSTSFFKTALNLAE